VEQSDSENSNASTTSFRRPGSSSPRFLISPSTVFINFLSISAPLTHTASRKFGVPYGPDAVGFATATEGFEEVVGRQKDREEREVGVRHDASIRGGTSVSASSMATTTPTVRLGHEGTEVGRGGCDLHGQSKFHVEIPSRNQHPTIHLALPLEHDQFRLEIPSENQNRIVHLPSYTNGISTTPSSSTSPSTPMPVPISEFGQISPPLSSQSQHYLNTSSVLELLSRNNSSRTYATAVESFLSSLSSIFPGLGC